MSEIILFLPGNIFHSNVTQEKMKRMLAERAGMDTLRKGDVPLLFGWQRIDALLAPDIYDPGPHELCAGSFTHVLHNRLTPQDSKWQTTQGVTGIDVTFHPEFAPPSDPQLIPTTYFFLLASQTVYYDHDPATGILTVPEGIVPPVPAIRFGSKVGIMIGKGGAPIREQWHAYQKDPTQKRLEALIQATEKVAQDSRVHIALLDLETPYVDSNVDVNILWSAYLEALDKQGLTSAFSPLEPHLSCFGEQAIEIQPPHRTLKKWTRHDVQLDHIRRAYDNINAQTLNERDRWLLAIARGSDALSAMDSQIRAQKAGTSVPVTKYREQVIKLGVACLNTLEGKEPLEALAIADPLLGPRLLNLLPLKDP